ncbi:MAG: UDP-N-acetylmuramoyl-tripeptide--D-alanyl-D-alanine ligase [Methylococcales bacterium]|nr:UDP-N-acetylmuramoyl-tripeptide--D-alanyl-D-alanine ligase [Methylococcales bacterium]
MSMRLSEIASSVGGQLLGQDRTISSVSIDTRTLGNSDLYIAIKGQNFDGHVFVDNAVKAGASAVLVEDDVKASIPVIKVGDSHLALAELAGAWKSKASIKTVGITGSNGKTTVKEMVATILAVGADTLFTQGNLNNDIGVPLTLLKIEEKHQYAVIEMGANHAGEISYSSHYVKPDVAVITNVGPAHIEGFGSLERTALAKGEIIDSVVAGGVAVLNRDDPFFPLWVEMAGDKKIATFGMSAEAKVRAKDIYSEINKDKFYTHFTLVTDKGEIAIKLGLAGQHNVINALTAASACLALDISLEQVAEGLEKAMPVSGRLEPLIDKLGNLVINDTYNANPSSLKVALDVLMQCKGESWVVLGAFAEMGANSEKIHKEMGELIKSMGVVRLLTVGADTQHAVKGFGEGASFFSSQKKLIAALKKELTSGQSILVKGSRTQKMEQVVASLLSGFKK